MAICRFTSRWAGPVTRLLALSGGSQTFRDFLIHAMNGVCRESRHSGLAMNLRNHKQWTALGFHIHSSKVFAEYAKHEQLHTAQQQNQRGKARPSTHRAAG